MVRSFSFMRSLHSLICLLMEESWRLALSAISSSEMMASLMPRSRG